MLHALFGVIMQYAAHALYNLIPCKQNALLRCPSNKEDLFTRVLKMQFFYKLSFYYPSFNLVLKLNSFRFISTKLCCFDCCYPIIGCS